MMLNTNVFRLNLWPVLTLLLLIFAAPAVRAADSTEKGESVQIMQAFSQAATQAGDSNVLKDHQKHVIMFLMGVPLLILILITGALGVAMVVYGKQVFTLHMIFAGLTVTLALAHLVTGLVWFYPF
jgi:F0F1-type ATP synthase membrane subunit a